MFSQQPSATQQQPNSNGAAALLAALAASTGVSMSQPIEPAPPTGDFLMPLLLNGWIAAIKAAQQQQHQQQHQQQQQQTLQLSPIPKEKEFNNDEPLNLSMKVSFHNSPTPSSSLPSSPSLFLPNVDQSILSNRKRGRPSGDSYRDCSEFSKKRERSGVGKSSSTTLPATSTSVRIGRGGGSMKTPKRFHCNQCGRGFTRSDGLQRHLRLHSGYRPFTCTVCRRSFSRSDHAQVHIRRHFILGNNSNVTPSVVTNNNTPANFNDHLLIKTSELNDNDNNEDDDEIGGSTKATSLPPDSPTPPAESPISVSGGTNELLN